METLAIRVANAFGNELDTYNYRQLFLEYDVYGTGKLRPREFKAALRTVGIHLTSNEFQGLMETFDLDDDGKISYNDFINMCQYTQKHENERSEMRSEYTENALKTKRSTKNMEYDTLNESKPRDLVLTELKERIRSKLASKNVSSNELYRMLNRKGDGALDVYELCYQMSQLLDEELKTDDIVDAYNMTETKTPYYLSYDEFVSNVLNINNLKYELNPAIDDDRRKHVSMGLPTQDVNSMNHRVLKNALRSNRQYKYKNGTFNILDKNASTEDVMFQVIDSCKLKQMIYTLSMLSKLLK